MEQNRDVLRALRTQCEYINNTISQLGCPNEGNFRTIDGGCYLYIAELMNPNDAKSLCENKTVYGRPGHLVEPKTSSINKAIFDEAYKIFGYFFNYWIGINDIDIKDYWVYTSTGLPATTTFFITGHPDGSGDGQRWFSVTRFDYNGA